MDVSQKTRRFDYMRGRLMRKSVFQFEKSSLGRGYRQKNAVSGIDCLKVQFV